MISKNKLTSLEKDISKFVFLGQKIYFQKTTFQGVINGISSDFVPYTFGESWNGAYSQISKLAPQVVVIYRPEVYNIDFLLALKEKYLTVGFFTEPLPFNGYEAEFDLVRRYSSFENYNFENCDLNISYNPVTCEVLSKRTKIVFSHPIPVSDDIFFDRKNQTMKASGIFLGRVTPERNEYLMALKHKFNLTVIDHGELEENFYHNYNIGLNLHSDSYPNFENRVLYHMAQSMIVLSQQVVPDYNLQHGKHYFEFDTPKDLEILFSKIYNDIQSYAVVANNGHSFAKNYATSNFLKKLSFEIKKEYEL